MTKYHHLFQKLSRYKYIAPAAFLWSAGMVGNLFNWLFNFLATRSLSIENFANLTFYTTLQYLISIFTASLTITINRFLAILLRENKQSSSMDKFGGLSIILGLSATFIYLFTAKFWAPLYNFPISNVFLILTSPMFFFMFALAWIRGVINAHELLIISGWTIIIEGITKFIIGILGYTHFQSFTFISLSIPLSLFTPFIFSLYILNKKGIFHKISYSLKIPKESYLFYIQSIILQIGVIAIINIDILISKRFLPSTEAGIYSLLSLIGKTLFFVNYTFTGILVPLVSSKLNSKDSSRKPFLVIIAITLVFSSLFTILVATLPQFTTKILIGEKYIFLTPYIFKYCIAISALSFSLIFSTYNLLKKKYLLSSLTLIVVAIEIILMNIYHNSINQIVNSLLFTSSLLTATMLLITLMDKNNIKIFKNIIPNE